MKLSFDPINLEYFYEISGWLGTILSFIFIFINLPESPEMKLLLLFLLLIIIFPFLYFGISQFNKRRQHISLKINNTDFVIKIGDIFNEKKSLKVIPFNEYFDTDVENEIISDKTLNGFFIEEFYKNNVSDLNDAISDSLKNQKLKSKKNYSRAFGKKDYYKLGTIAKIDKDYLLTALTHFDHNNNTHLEIDEYVSFLMTFWNEVSKLYNGSNITMPIIGNGMTQFKFHGNITTINAQKLIELIIWTYKSSNIKLKSKITIVIYDKDEDNADINLLAFKRMK